MTEKELQDEIQRTYICVLDAAKTLEPGSTEWDFVWGILDTIKTYFEAKKRTLEVE